MTENKDSRLPTGLIWLLIYQWLLVVASLGYSGAAVVGLCDILSRPFAAFDVVVVSSAILVLAGWAVVMIFASVGIRRRSPRGYLLGMIGHLLLGIPALLGALGFGSMYLLSSVSASKDTRAWAPLFLIFALMWLPLVLLSAWGFFYLRRVCKSLPS